MMDVLMKHVNAWIKMLFYSDHEAGVNDQLKSNTICFQEKKALIWESINEVNLSCKIHVLCFLCF